MNNYSILKQRTERQSIFVVITNKKICEKKRKYKLKIYKLCIMFSSFYFCVLKIMYQINQSKLRIITYKKKKKKI